MTQLAVLVEIEVTSPTGAAAVLRFTDAALSPFPPTDNLRPNIAFDSRLTEAPAIRRMLWDNLETLAPGLGVGALTLANADHALDAYEGWAWGAITVRLWTSGQTFAQGRLVLAGLCAQPAFAFGSDAPAQVKVALYDYGREASKALQPTLYAGSNGVAGALYEGTADDRKGAPKPLAFGDLRTAHLPVPLVNAAEQAHQLHDGPVDGSITLHDRGDDAGLVADGNLAGAAFDAANPAAAHWVSDRGRGLFKMNATPVGQLTAGCKGDATGGYVETAGPILARLLARAGVPGARIGAGLAALPAPAVIGAWFGEPTTLTEALRFVAAGAPAAVLPDREGVWQAYPWGPPAATPDAEISALDIIACASDPPQTAPIGEVRVGWGRIWRTFEGEALAPDLVGTAEQARLASEYRWAVSADETVKARYPDTWRTVEIPTALRMEAPALALAAALRSLLGLKADGRPRRAWRLTLPIETVLAVRLGATVAVDAPAYGLAGNHLVIGEEPLRPRRTQGVLTVWG
jgi:hypothetical protein